MDGTDQATDMIGWGVLTDAMAEVEDMRRSGRMQILVGRSETVEHPPNLGFNLIGWGE